MKGYLFDGNVPSRLRFSPKLPIIPLTNIGRNPSDSQIWDFARRHDLVIVSKDTDFSDRIITSSPPPRVAHLRFGNLRRNEYHATRIVMFTHEKSTIEDASEQFARIYSTHVGFPIGNRL